MILNYFNEHSGATETPWLYDSSSFITAIKYNKIYGSLTVRIAEKEYSYSVTIELANQMSVSSSWGKFYNSNIKGKAAPAAPEIPSTQRTAIEPSRAVEDIVDGVAKRVNVLLPDTVGEWVAISEIVLHSIKAPAELKFGLLGLSTFSKFVLPREEWELPKEYQIAVNLAIGYSLIGALEDFSFKMAGVTTPYASAAYQADRGAIIGTISQTQVASALLGLKEVGVMAARSIRQAISERKLGEMGIQFVREKAALAAKYPFAGAGETIRKGMATTMRQQRMRSMASKAIDFGIIATAASIGPIEKEIKLKKKDKKRR